MVTPLAAEAAGGYEYDAADRQQRGQGGERPRRGSLAQHGQRRRLRAQGLPTLGLVYAATRGGRRRGGRAVGRVNDGRQGSRSFRQEALLEQRPPEKKQHIDTLTLWGC